VLFERRGETVSRSVRIVRIVNAIYGPYTVRKTHLLKGTKNINHVLFERRGATVCRSARFVRIVNAVYGLYMVRTYTVRKMHVIKRLKRKKISNEGYCHKNKANIHVYLVL